MDIVQSKNDVSIRLTGEQWFHITEEHSEMAGNYFEVLETVDNPDAIYSGKAEEMLAIREIESGKYLVVVYKETSSDDGFIITAFFTKKINKIKKRVTLWP